MKFRHGRRLARLRTCRHQKIRGLESGKSGEMPRLIKNTKRRYICDSEYNAGDIVELDREN